MRPALLAWVPLLAAGLAGPAAAADGLGAATFARVCAACHGAQGQGTPGFAPALAGPLAPLLARPEGRDYARHVVLHGLSGRIVSQGQTYTGAMPAQSALADDELAAVLTHLARDLNGLADVAVTPAELAQARAQAPAPSHKQLRELRSRLLP